MRKLRPVQMKRVSAIFLEDAKEEVLRKLKELGIIEFADIYALGDVDHATPGETRAKAADLLTKIEGLLEILDERADAKAMKSVGKVKVEDGDPRELFHEAEEKLFSIGEKVTSKSARLEDISKEEEELLELKDKLDVLATLKVNPSDTGGLRNMHIIVGVAAGKELRELEEGLKGVSPEIMFHSASLDTKNAGVIVLFPRDREVDVSRVLRLHRFEEIRIPPRFQIPLADATKKAEDDTKSLEAEKEKLEAELREIAAKETPDLLRLRELLGIEKFLEEANKFLGKTKRTYVFTGWSPADRAQEVVEIVKKASDGICSVAIEDPKREEKPPTLLANPPQVKPMELLIDTYGVPSYTEIDPTMFVAITFPILFGLMFGDIGQGILILLTGFLLGYKIDMGASVRKLGRILVLCGITATFFGFMYGSVFGLEGERIEHYLGFELHPLWLNPIEDTAMLMSFALRLGVFLLIAGCAINILNEVSHHRYIDIFVSPYGLPGVWILLGGTFLVSKHGVDIFSLIRDIRIIPGVLLPFLLLGFGEHYVSKISLPMAFFEAWDNLSRYLVNSLSYIRVMALAIIHGALNMIMVTIMEMMPASTVGTAAKVVIFVVGNLGIFIVEMFVSFIQTLRLHYYEWFSKFYAGDGKRFIPFKVIREYTSLGGE